MRAATAIIKVVHFQAWIMSKCIFGLVSFEADGRCIKLLEAYLSTLRYHGEQLGLERGSRGHR